MASIKGYYPPNQSLVDPHTCESISSSKVRNFPSRLASGGEGVQHLLPASDGPEARGPHTPPLACTHSALTHCAGIGNDRTRAKPHLAYSS